MLLLAVATAVVSACENLFRPRKLVGFANTYDEAVATHDATVQRTNDAAVASRHLLWKAGASPATTVALCGRADIPLGTINNTETDTGVAQTVLLLGKGGTKKMVASGAIAAGAAVYCAASGKVAASGLVLVGAALTAAASDGDIIEVQDCAPVVVNGNAAVLAEATTLTAADSGKTLFLNATAEFAVTLPTPALGLRFKFVVAGAPSGASYTIATASSANIIKGAFASAADAGGSMDSEASGGDTITFVDGQALAGDWVELESDGTSWFATGIAADEDAITITTAS